MFKNLGKGLWLSCFSFPKKLARILGRAIDNGLLVNSGPDIWPRARRSRRVESVPGTSG